MPETASRRLMEARFVLSLCLFALADVALVFAIKPFERWQCPPDALLWGTTQFLDTTSIAVLPLVGAGVWLLAVSLVNFASSLAKSSFGADPARTARFAKLVVQVINWITVAAMGGVLFLVANGISKTYCVTVEKVTYRDGLFAPTETYAWSVVNSIIATCEHSVDSKGKSFDKANYALIMSNQRRIDLDMSPVADEVRIASNALRDVPYHYDASGVSPQCAPGILGPLMAQAAATK